MDGMNDLLQSIARLHVLVVGDVLLDQYLWGDATRISPEAPVPVVRVERDTFTVGGAGNVALNLRALGASVELAGVAGDDADGRRLRAILADSGVEFDPRLLLDGIHTIVKTRVMCRNQQLCRLDREPPPSRCGLPGEWIAHDLAGAIARADAVILSDYAKGVVDNAMIARVRDLAGPGKLVALDPKPRAGLAFDGLGLVTPNRAEALQLANYLPGPPDEGFPAAEICRRLHETYRSKLLAVTLGADGMLLSVGGEVSCTMPTAARAVFDVSGAGDTVISVLAAALAAGATPEVAARLANLAAGVVVGKVGTATATPEEILAYAAEVGA